MTQKVDVIVTHSMCQSCFASKAKEEGELDVAELYEVVSVVIRAVVIGWAGITVGPSHVRPSGYRLQAQCPPKLVPRFLITTALPPLSSSHLGPSVSIV